MRYIGSKIKLVPFIRAAVDQYSPNSVDFCDLFAGTGVVANEFKRTHRVTANDILYLSFVLNVANLELTKRPTFSVFRSHFGQDPITLLNSIRPDPSDATENDFVANNYSPIGMCGRRYFTPSNAIRIDRIRQHIDKCQKETLLDRHEYFYLLAALVREVPSVSSTTGTYGAYLKTWDSRATKELTLRYFDVTQGRGDCRAYNCDANMLIGEISGDVLYLDTPYNARQYSSNYHVLESIARYDNPEVFGKTGLRTDRIGESGYCRRDQVYGLYKDLLRRANFRTIFISYSSDGILSAEELSELVREFSGREPIAFQRIPYRRYKRTSGDVRSVDEFLVVGKR